jgi:putative phosphoribosyl transferase
MRKFADRQSAGKMLADELGRYRLENPLILALLRGGVPVANEISKALSIPLDIWIVRKIGAPWQPEFAIGAIAEDGYTYLDTETIEGMGISESELNAILESKNLEIKERIFMYRGVLPRPVFEGRDILIIDDGVATGATVYAAAGSVRNYNPKKIILAVPVVSLDALELLSNMVDEQIYLMKPDNFIAVGAWYDDFKQITDEDVLLMLNRTPEP